jgi:hypothetical protein
VKNELADKGVVLDSASEVSEVTQSRMAAIKIK